MSDSYAKTTGGRYLQRGDTFDPEDWRMTHRLRKAHGILLGMGIESTHEHKADCGRHPDKLRNVCFGWKESVVCTCGRDNKGSEWPEWVTGSLFDLAFNLACEYQDTHGAYERSKAYAAKAERDRAAS